MTATAAKFPPTLTVAQAANVAGISRQHAYNLVNSGALPSVRLGAAIRVPTYRLFEMLGTKAD